MMCSERCASIGLHMPSYAKDMLDIFFRHSWNKHVNFFFWRGTSIQLCWRFAVSLEPNIQLTWYQVVNSSLSNGCNLVEEKKVVKWTRQHARIHQRLSSTKGHLQPKVVLHQRFSSTRCRFPPKVIFHQRLSSTKNCLPPKIVFRLP